MKLVSYSRGSEAGTPPLVLFLKALDSTCTLAWSTASLLQCPELRVAAALRTGLYFGGPASSVLTPAWDVLCGAPPVLVQWHGPGLPPVACNGALPGPSGFAGTAVSVIGTAKGIEKEAEAEVADDVCHPQLRHTVVSQLPSLSFSLEELFLLLHFDVGPCL